MLDPELVSKLAKKNEQSPSEKEVQSKVQQALDAKKGQPPQQQGSSELTDGIARAKMRLAEAPTHKAVKPAQEQQKWRNFS